MIRGQNGSHGAGLHSPAFRCRSLLQNYTNHPTSFVSILDDHLNSILSVTGAELRYCHVGPNQEECDFMLNET